MARNETRPVLESLVARDGHSVNGNRVDRVVFGVGDHAFDCHRFHVIGYSKSESGNFARQSHRILILAPFLEHEDDPKDIDRIFDPKKDDVDFVVICDRSYRPWKWYAAAIGESGKVYCESREPVEYAPV